MSAAQNSFRGSFFGGFNRQDVLNYLERTARDHSQQMESLQKKLSQANLEKNEKISQLADLSEKQEYIEAENHHLSDVLERTKTELEDKRGRLSVAEEELSVLRGRASELEAKAEAYERLRDRAATIELEAHTRAQKIENDANSQAGSVHNQVEDWLSQTETRYERLRSDINATLAHAIEELARVEKSLSESSESFKEHDESLENLVRWCESGPVSAEALSADAEAVETAEGTIEEVAEEAAEEAAEETAEEAAEVTAEEVLVKI